MGWDNAGNLKGPQGEPGVDAAATVLVNEQVVTSYTAVLADAAREISMNNAAGNEIRIPLHADVPYEIGTVLYGKQRGDGQTSFVGDTVAVTLNTASSLKARTKNSRIDAHKIGTDEWDIGGDLEGTGVSGDVIGPSSAVDLNFGCFDGVTGKRIKDSLYGPSDFATAAQGATADTAVQPGDLATIAITGAYSDLTGAPTTWAAAAIVSGTFADSRIAESNVTQHQASLSITWSQLASMPTTLAGYGIVDAVLASSIGTAAAADSTDFATAAQGVKADSAVQPGDLGTAAHSASTDFATAAQGAKADSAVQPGDLGTAAAADTTAFATAAQGGLADSAVQPGDLGTAAAANTGDFATAAQGVKADSALQPGDVNTWLQITQAAYDALSPPDSGILYVIVG